ncbi:Zn-dependent hydrolase, glyoxylase [Caldisphaera lagunensis DSM 15908]|uniref:Zn-dependent hydrolase, glyoxylase n=1 Tax=Caldisphaera lagunensis (strain DSM 15908 / JCM 11604 / ANMR 0165 / IC-154) TaxID=1056495 RepID=L0AAR7_CALLD|nr:MBL fold metallo-hydrolase [Caldisphaera lagunensis]AFZ70212.1 Zn-dependent hydrolase, glyoxylase [Caldisphaera lagunensis DSM 15908]
MEIIRLESYNFPLDRPANNYLIKHDKYNILIDAGATKENLMAYESKIDYILITHGHWDHTYGITGIKNKKICASQDTYNSLINGEFKYSANRIAEIFGYNGKEFNINNEIKTIIDKTLSYYDDIANALKFNEYIPLDECDPIKQNIIEYIPCPGHSNDHVCYFISNNLFAGDNILPGGGLTLLDFLKYQESIIKLFTLNNWDLIRPGHGPDTKRIDIQQWIKDTLTGKEKKMMQLSSILNSDWVSINDLLPKLYPNLNGPLLYIAARSMIGYLGSLENMKIIEVDRNHKPWRARKLMR